MITLNQIHDFFEVTHTAINVDAFARESGVSQELLKKILATVQNEMKPLKERNPKIKPYGKLREATKLKIYETMLHYGYKA